MAYTRAFFSEEIDAPADQVWSVLGAFNCLPAILPKLVAKSELDNTGLVRSLTITDGVGRPYKRYEQLIKYDALTRTLVYRLIDRPRSRVPVRDYTATIKVKKITSGRCRVAWSGRFQPKHGTPNEVRAQVESVYAAAIDGVKRKISIQAQQN